MDMKQIFADLKEEEVEYLNFLKHKERLRNHWTDNDKEFQQAFC